MHVRTLQNVHVRSLQNMHVHSLQNSRYLPNVKLCPLVKKKT
jgi:hypothetical protein